MAPAGSRAAGGGFAGGGGGFGGDTTSLNAAVKYVKQHGGGEIGVSSQSTAAAAILDGYTNVAGLGGFSGRESSVTASWIAMEVRDGSPPLGDRRQHARQLDSRATPAPGSQAAMDVVEKTLPVGDVK